MTHLEIDWRFATAAHEIGHSLLHALAGHKLSSIRIDKVFLGKEYSGEVKWCMPEIEDRAALYALSFEDLRVICLGCVAGQEAQCLWLSAVYGITIEEARELTAYGASLDLRNFKELAAHIEDFTLRDARREAAIIVRKHWNKLELLTDKLADRHRISPHTVTKLVTSGSEELVPVINPTIYVPPPVVGVPSLV